jgi:gas vesicle protein
MAFKVQQEFFIGALIGGAIGSAAVLLLTPISGARLRHQLLNKIDHLNGSIKKRTALHRAHSPYTAHHKKTRKTAKAHKR